MNLVSLRHLMIGMTMFVAAGLAIAMVPARQLAADRPTIDLERLVPKQFGEWRLDESIIPLQVDADLQNNLDKTYSQVLARTYVNAAGRRIMISLAYSGGQSLTTQVHKPEVCYPAQGFAMLAMQKDTVKTPYGAIPAMRIITRQGMRNEPVTYWIRTGDAVVRGAIEQNVARIKYGFRGFIPDGLLFRLSEISQDAPASFALQDRFVGDLLAALTPANRRALVGTEI